MGTTDICIRDDLHKELKELRDTLKMKSFSDLFKLLKDSFLSAPPGVPADVFKAKKEAYIESYPDEFIKAVGMCLGVTDPMEFGAVFEEAIRGLITQYETAPEERLILECGHCHHVWDYKGKRVQEKIGAIHCPVCQSTASRKWVRKLVMPDAPDVADHGGSTSYI